MSPACSAIAAVLASAPLAAPALALQGPPVSPPVSTGKDPAIACTALQSGYTASPISIRFANLPEAPTSIISARVVPSSRGLPTYCRVEGQIAPSIGFLMKLPTTTWNGKLMMGGCGGPCGTYLSDRLDPALARNYAVVSTDMGHKGIGWVFAYQNLAAQIDFGSRSTHLTAVVGKAIVDTYYGQPARYAYFQGCSTGGRQAMVEAQRFPEDFNGIIGGAPPYYETGDTPLFLSWGARANIAEDGSRSSTPPSCR
jgi:feruloyl esterase